jgi:hypothetical protein
MAPEPLHVITLVHGRERQLDNLIRGLERGRRAPDALWVVCMNQPLRHLSSAEFPIHCLHVQGDAPGLPLAKARNAARGCDAEHWVFLDVDCIPGEGLIDSYAQGFEEHPDAVQVGEVRYLPDSANLATWTQTSLEREAVVHPLSQYRGEAGSALPHHLFWSLNFACTRRVFETIGGFDEGYAGYGAEDTDFAFAARAKGIDMRVSSALAFHQYHPTWRPPLNHFQAILANARRFHQRWQVWPMEGWLSEFADRGLLDWSTDALTVLREPQADEIDACFDETRSGF